MGRVLDAARGIKQARGAAGLTQRELATRAGTSQAAVSAYESGRKEPSVATFTRLLEAAGAQLEVRPDPRRAEEGEALERAGRRLFEVLALAEKLPSRHARTLGYPRIRVPS